MGQRQLQGEAEAHHHPVGATVGEHQRQVLAEAAVELADQCLLAEAEAEEGGQYLPVEEEGEGERCSLAEAEEVGEDRLWMAEEGSLLREVEVEELVVQWL